MQLYVSEKLPPSTKNFFSILKAVGNMESERLKLPF